MGAGAGGEEERPDQALIAHEDARDRGIDEATLERRGGDRRPGDAGGERHRPGRRDLRRCGKVRGGAFVPGASAIDQNSPWCRDR